MFAWRIQYISLALWKHHVSLLLPRKFTFSLSIFISIIRTDAIFITIIRTDEDPSLRIESFPIINLRGVSTKLKRY